MTAFPTRLQTIRKIKGLSQEDLSKQVNTTKSTISNYENGHSTPSNDMLIQLADVLETTTDYLLGRTDLSHYPDSDLINLNLTPKEIEFLKGCLLQLRSIFG